MYTLLVFLQRLWLLLLLRFVGSFPSTCLFTVAFLESSLPDVFSYEIFLAAFDFHHLSMSWLPSGNLQVPSLCLTALKTWHEGVPQRPKGYNVPGWAVRHACPWVFPFVDGHCCPPSVLSWCLGIIYHFPSSSGYIRTMPPPAISPVWIFSLSFLFSPFWAATSLVPVTKNSHLNHCHSLSCFLWPQDCSMVVSHIVTRVILFFSFSFYIKLWLVNNVVLASNIQQYDSVINIHLSILFQILFPFSLLQNIQ